MYGMHARVCRGKAESLVMREVIVQESRTGPPIAEHNDRTSKRCRLTEFRRETGLTLLANP